MERPRHFGIQFGNIFGNFLQVGQSLLGTMTSSIILDYCMLEMVIIIIIINPRLTGVSAERH